MTASRGHRDRNANPPRSKDGTAIEDTAEAVGHVPRTPTRAKLLPIGHMGLERCPELISRLSLPQSTIRITSLYISWYVQRTAPERRRNLCTQRQQS